MVTPERIHWDGAYGGKDISRGKIIRICASYVSLGFRGKEGHAKCAAKNIHNQIKATSQGLYNAECFWRRKFKKSKF